MAWPWFGDKEPAGPHIVTVDEAVLWPPVDGI